MTPSHAVAAVAAILAAIDIVANLFPPESEFTAPRPPRKRWEAGCGVLMGALFLSSAILLWLAAS